MTGIFYGSTTGTTEELAGKIAAVLGIAAADIHNVGNTGADEVNRYDLLLLGTSTWGDGRVAGRLVRLSRCTEKAKSGREENRSVRLRRCRVVSRHLLRRGGPYL